jgi:hypothetical protein
MEMQVETPMLIRDSNTCSYSYIDPDSPFLEVVCLKWVRENFRRTPKFVSFVVSDTPNDGGVCLELECFFYSSDDNCLSWKYENSEEPGEFLEYAEEELIKKFKIREGETKKVWVTMWEHY